MIVKKYNTNFIINAIQNLQNLLGDERRIIEDLLGDYYNIMMELYDIINLSNSPSDAYGKIYRLLEKDEEKSLIIVSALFGISKEYLRRICKFIEEKGIHLRESNIIMILFKGDRYSNEFEKQVLHMILEEKPEIGDVIGWENVKRMFSIPKDSPIWYSLLLLATRGSISASLGDILNKYLAELIVKRCGVSKEHIEIEKNKIRACGKTFTAPRRVDIIVRNSRDIPRILCMISYQITTSSAQTAKGIAEEDFRKLKEDIDKQCRCKPLLIGFVDGIGWIARGEKDIERMVKIYDYVFTFSRDKLEEFIDIVKKSMSC